MSITISFTPDQFAALTDLLSYSEDDERRWAEECCYDYEEKDTDTPEMILKKLIEFGADNSPYGNIQQVRIAIGNSITRARENAVEAPQLKKEDVLTEEQFIKQMDKVGQSWKDLAGMLYNRMPYDDLAELAEEWKEEKKEEEEEEDDEEEEDEDCPGFIEDYEWVECCDSGCKHRGHWFEKTKEQKEKEAKELKEEKEEAKWRAMIDGVAATEEEEEEEEIELEEGEELCDKCGVMLEPDNDTICEGLCNWCAK